jgi:hypothetical protein
MMERLHCSHLATLSGCGLATADSHSSGSWHSSSGFSEPIAPTAGNARFTVGLGNRHAAIMVPTSTLLNKCGPILDRRPPASSDPYLTTMLLVANACGLPLPQTTRKALQLAAALAAANGAAAAAAAAAAPMRIPSSQRPSHSRASFESPSCGASAAPSCSLSGLSDSLCSLAGSDDDSLAGSADSEAVLLSALDRLDGFVSSASMPVGFGGPGSCCMYGSDDEDVRSDASSPVLASSSLAGAVEADEAMFYE